MLFQARPNGAEGIEKGFGEKSPGGQYGKQGHGRMSLAQDEPVPLRIIGPCGVDGQGVPVQRHEDIEAGEAEPKWAAPAVWDISAMRPRICRAKVLEAVMSMVIPGYPSVS
jgi:hypothetical protein